MSEIVKGDPAGGWIDQIKPLVEAANADPGEWYSMPYPDGVTQNTLRSAARQAITDVLTEFSTRKGRLWIRIKP